MLKFNNEMWTCPTCSRIFKNTNQDHSCIVTSIESHFIGKQENVKETFEKILSVVNAFEGMKINSVKNAILFTAVSHFLAVKPKKKWLDIEFILDEKLEGFPIHKVVQATKTKWAHFVRLGAPEEIDEQLKSWLKRAYLVSKQRK
ncbi:MAG: DUF5655 domain-containing protein [Bacteroidales bacterium]